MSQQQNNPERVHRRRIQASMQIIDEIPAEQPDSNRARSQSGRHSSRHELQQIWKRIPAPLRMILAALCIVLILTITIAVTRSYLAQQEERRRLEAEAAERAQHPLEYADYINYYANLQNIDPALVCAVILSESSFNPLAESSAQARGLMQLVPETAEWIAGKLDEDNEQYSFDLLFDPETNIRYGTWYLGYLSDRFNGDPLKIVCAYHAGQGNVDAWLANPKYSSDGITLDAIPYENTSTYASRVLNAQRVYQKHYFQAPEVQTDH